LARLDRLAERFGLSRAEYLRQVIAGRRDLPAKDFTPEDLERFAAATADLLDSAVMRGAWE
jgi:hypothetical protein